MCTHCLKHKIILIYFQVVCTKVDIVHSDAITYRYRNDLIRTHLIAQSYTCTYMYMYISTVEKLDLDKSWSVKD